MLNGEDASAGQFGEFGEKRRTVEFFRRAIAITKRVINTDGVELGVRFLHEPLDIVLVVPTMIIASIGENQQGTFGVMCTPHLAQTKVDSVQKGSPALWGSHGHARLEILDAIGERASEFGSFIKTDQEELVLGIGGLEELKRGFASLVDFIGHAAGKIEDHADGNGDVFGGKTDDFLLDVVFEDAEIIRFESSYKAIVGIGDSDIDEGEVDVGANDLAGMNFDRRSVAGDVGGGNDGVHGLVLCGKGGSQEEEKQASEQAEGYWTWHHAKHPPIASHGFPHPLVSARGPRGKDIIASVTEKARGVRGGMAGSVVERGIMRVRCGGGMTGTWERWSVAGAAAAMEDRADTRERHGWRG